MKLTTVTHISLDGVMQGLGASDEDPRGGFERGGWAIPLFDEDAAAFFNDLMARTDAFLLGRKTYEIFAGFWGAMDDPDSDPIAGPLNRKPKYVATTTLTDPRWQHSTAVDGAAIAKLRAEQDGELQVHGSGVLVRWLLENDLVDELIVVTYPVIVGQGTRLFPENGPDAALQLVEARTTPGGLITQVYRPSGRPEYQIGTPDPNA